MSVKVTESVDPLFVQTPLATARTTDFLQLVKKIPGDDRHGCLSVGCGDVQDVLIPAMRQEVAFIADTRRSVCI
ncbi:MAG: hypothetical protein V1874_05665 [Spirochaetota bacterium]